MSLLLAQLPGPDAPPVAAWPGHEVSVTTRSGQQDLFVRRAANPGRQTMVFIHGLGGSSTNWTDLMACLQPAVDSHALDLPGFGFSGPSPTGSYSPTVHIEAIKAYLDQELPNTRIHLVGNSMGGLVSTLFAARYPEVVETLTLISPALPDVRPVVMSSRAPMLAASFFGPILLKPMQSGTPRERAMKLLALCYADPTRIRSERIDEVIEENRARAGFAWGQKAFIESLRGIVGSTFQRGERSAWAQARKVTAPVLWIHGKRDRLVHWGLIRRGAHAFKNCSTLIVDDSGHVTQMEHPQLTAEVILKHIQKAPTSKDWLPAAR